VRVICPSCRTPVQPDLDLFEESGIEPSSVRHHDFFEGAGCRVCEGTGYRGRTAICELLDLSDTIRQMILDRRSAAEIKKVAREEGMASLRESALQKVYSGVTTLQEINKVTFID
jgi:type IV pilus assembly protein PilB